jgi:hypothetical protein
MEARSSKNLVVLWSRSFRPRTRWRGRDFTSDQLKESVERGRSVSPSQQPEAQPTAATAPEQARGFAERPEENTHAHEPTPFTLLAKDFAKLFHRRGRISVGRPQSTTWSVAALVEIVGDGGESKNETAEPNGDERENGQTQGRV